MATIKDEMTLVCMENSSIKPSDFDFLIDIAGLVIAARRSLSYTYFSKEKIETGFHLFLFLREFAFYFNYTIVVILFFMHSHSTP